MKEEISQIGKWRLRIGFASSDFASCIIWQVISLYIVYFYTNIMGLNSGACATMFLLTKLVDALAALVVGCLIDKTHTRLGKSRPWILGGCIPLGISFVLAFSVPDFSAGGKLVYAYITYTLLSVTFTICNLPLSSMLSSLSNDPKERTTLATMRLIGCIVASTLVSAFTLSLVKWFGGENEIKGFHILSIVFAIAAVVIFIFCVWNTRELPAPIQAEDKKSGNAVENIVNLIKWRPFYITSFMQFFVFTSYHVCVAALTYYFLYVVQSMMLAALSATLMTFVQIIGNLSAPVITRKITKRDAFLFSSAINTISLLIIWLSTSQVILLILGITLYGISQGLRQTLFYAIPPDAIDYCSLVLKKDVSGTFSALCGFLIKLAGAISTSVVSLLLAWGQYDAALKVQPDKAVMAITIAFIGLPFLFNIISCAIMLFYNVDQSCAQVRSLLDIQQKAWMESQSLKAGAISICSPVEGEMLPISECKDEILASGAVGYGIAVEPEGEWITAPVSGEVKILVDTGHAVMIVTKTGMEVLVHVGIDTVKLNGEGFRSTIKVGYWVEKGDRLIHMDLEFIKNAGYFPTTAVLIMNLPDEKNIHIVNHKKISAGDTVMEIIF